MSSISRAVGARPGVHPAGCTVEVVSLVDGAGVDGSVVGSSSDGETPGSEGSAGVVSDGDVFGALVAAVS
ncbi:MAG: hypothetical protein LBE07_00625, partial [Gordonia sp. (in: high G+C Gram-positive bacteria)]|nr:hypothetical protein [Gordonia sp. (in: high G+C Gram-positive bacteria)]